MNEWEAKYKALAAGIKDERLIANAEQLVRGAISISQGSGLPLEQVLNEIIKGIQPPPRPQLFGFPVSLQEWMPAHYAAIGNSENIVITDLRTGEIRRVTKDVMGKVVSKFFEESREQGY